MLMSKCKQMISAETRLWSTILGGATHYVSTVTEQTPAQERKTELKPLNEI